MGKGRGEDGCFNRFLLESYFAFHLKKWAAFFMVVGILFIIAGIVVFEVYPSAATTKIATSQAVTSSSSANYKYWTAQSETNTYYFQNVNSMSTAAINCDLSGPFVLAGTITKAQIQFSGDTVTYTSTINKLFSSGQSPPSLFNPPYLQLANLESEQTILESAFDNSTLPAQINSFFLNIVPNLVGAKALAEGFPSTFQTILQTDIFPNFFPNLSLVIDNYYSTYFVYQLDTFVPVYYNQSANGIWGDQYLAYIHNDQCRNGHPPSEDNFIDDLVTGFQNLGSTSCAIYFRTHALNNTLWLSTNVTAYNMLASLTPNNHKFWIDPVNPSTTGYCAPVNLNSAASHWSVSTDQINDFCSMIRTYENNFPIPVSQPNLGPFFFCNGGFNLTNSPPITMPASVPASVASAIPLVFPSLNLNYTYSNNFVSATCQSYISALTDVPGFIIPVYGNPTVVPNGYSFSPSELGLLSTYIQGFVPKYKQWFTYLWRTTYSCSTCVVGSLNATSGAFVDKDFLELLFPELATVTVELKQQYALFNPNPVPLSVSSVWDPILSANGFLNYLFYLDNNTISSIYQWQTAQSTAIANYAHSELTNYFKKSFDITVQNAGYLQFGSAHLACGIQNATNYCSVARSFYGVTDSSEDYEFGIVSYVPTGSTGYYNSFTTADQSLRDTIDLSELAYLFDNVLVANPEIGVFFNISTSTSSTKYAYYLLSTFIPQTALTSSSGLVSTRTGLQWITGFQDNNLNLLLNGQSVSTNFGFDPDGSLPTVNVNTGGSDISTTYTLNSVNGRAYVGLYPKTQNVQGLRINEGFAPKTFSGNSTVQYFDLELQRTFNYKTSKAPSTYLGVAGYLGQNQASDWAVNSDFGIQTANLMPSPFNPILYYSPCDQQLTTQCAFSPSSDLTTSILVDDRIGLVLATNSCYIISVALSYTPFSAPNGVPHQAIVSQARKFSARSVSPDLVNGYVPQFTDITNTSEAVLIALVVIGGLFFFVGILWIVFYLMRQKRKNSSKAMMDLVNDPFGEKQSSVGTIKY